MRLAAWQGHSLPADKRKKQKSKKEKGCEKMRKGALVNFFINKKTIQKRIRLMGLLLVLWLLWTKGDSYAAQVGQPLNLPVIWSKTHELTRPELGR